MRDVFSSLSDCDMRAFGLLRELGPRFLILVDNGGSVGLLYLGVNWVAVSLGTSQNIRSSYTAVC